MKTVEINVTNKVVLRYIEEFASMSCHSLLFWDGDESICPVESVSLTTDCCLPAAMMAGFHWCGQTCQSTYGLCWSSGSKLHMSADWELLQLFGYSWSPWLLESLTPWLLDSTAQKFLVYLTPWLLVFWTPGLLVPRTLRILGSWIHGHMDSWSSVLLGLYSHIYSSTSAYIKQTVPPSTSLRGGGCTVP